MDNTRILDKINFKFAGIDDFDFYYNLKCEENNLYWSGFNHAPQYDALKKSYENNFINGDIKCLIILFNDRKIGEIHYKVENDIIDYLGIGISESYTGFGYFSVLKFIIFLKENYSHVRYIIGYILPNNVASWKVHNRCGFIRTGKSKKINNKELYEIIYNI